MITVSLRNVSYRYPNHDALFTGITFDISHGEAVAVVGVNGSGKTTLLEILAGARRPSSGIVSPGENCRTVLLPTNMDHFLLPWYSVDRNLTFFAAGQRRQGNGGREAALALIGTFFPKLVATNLSREVYKLSTGEKAVVGYACAMEADPDLLVLDELFGNLSASFLPKLIGEIHGRLAAGLSLVFTSHDPDVVKALGKRKIALT